MQKLNKKPTITQQSIHKNRRNTLYNSQKGNDPFGFLVMQKTKSDKSDKKNSSPKLKINSPA